MILLENMERKQCWGHYTGFGVGSTSLHPSQGSRWLRRSFVFPRAQHMGYLPLCRPNTAPRGRRRAPEEPETGRRTMNHDCSPITVGARFCEAK